MASSCSPLLPKRCDGTTRSPGESQFRLAQHGTGNCCAAGESNCAAKQTTKAGITTIFAGNSELLTSRTSLAILERERVRKPATKTAGPVQQDCFCCTHL